MGRTNNMIALYQVFDSLFPLGAYVFSGGMETYTQMGFVHDKNSLTAFLKAQLYVMPYNDLGVAAKTALGEDFVLLDGLCAAMKQPFEIRRGSERLCRRFLKAMESLADYPSLGAYRKAISNEQCDGHYPVAVGLFVRDLNEVQVDKAMELYCYNMLSVIVNHAVKLIPLGQVDGQSALHEALADIPQTVQKALVTSLDELGVSGCGLDLRAMQHETLGGRLYSS